MASEHSEKFKELYEHAKQLHFQEQERFTRVEQKAAWHLSALTVLIGIGGFSGKFIANLLPPKTLIEGCLVFIGALFGAFSLWAWYTSFRVLKAEQRLAHLQLNVEVLDFFLKNKRLNVHYSIAKRCQEAFAYNVKVTDRKIRLLAKSYKTTRIALVFLFIFLALYLIHSWKVNESDVNIAKGTPAVSYPNRTKKGVDAMTDNTPNLDTQPDDPGPDPSEEQPDTSINAPENIYLTESFDDSPNNSGESESDD